MCAVVSVCCGQDRAHHLYARITAHRLLAAAHAVGAHKMHLPAALACIAANWGGLSKLGSSCSLLPPLPHPLLSGGPTAARLSLR